MPSGRVLVRRITPATRRRTRGMSLGGNGPTGFPELHLIDSAFSEAHRQRSRAYSVMVDQATGEEIVIVEEQDDPNKVQWNEDDPENPQNWTARYKWFITILCGVLTINVTFASTAPASATEAIAIAFGTTIEISTLATSLFLFGYCVGPLLWAPLSEMFGRRPVFIYTMFIYTLFQIPGAVAANITTVLVSRFLAGVFAAAPLTNCGGVIADIWDSIGRGPAMSVFTLCVFVGPTVLGPTIGGYLTMSYLGWRWVFWIMGIFALLCWSLVVAFLPETYAPVLLAKRAKSMRAEQPEKNAAVFAELERADFSFKSIVTRTLLRPFIMLVKEPILALITLYLSVIYGLLYALFSVFPLIWEDAFGLRNFNNGETGLVFIFVGVGSTIGALLNIYLQRHYKELVPKWRGHPPPEERLWGSMAAGPFLIVGIFGLGWTGQYASVPWWAPAIFAVFLGVSFTLVFISFLSYIIETYLMYSSSALASNTIIRSAVGGAFPLFTTQMFTTLGIGGACSLIGGIAILISPSPFIFYYYGARIRQGSTFAPCLDIHMKAVIEEEERIEREKKGPVGV